MSSTTVTSSNTTVEPDVGTNTYAIIILVIGVLLFFVGLFALFYYWDSAVGFDGIPLWIWLLIGLGFTLMIIGGVWWMFWGSSKKIVSNVGSEIKGLETKQDAKINSLQTSLGNGTNDNVILLQQTPNKTSYTVDLNTGLYDDFVRPQRRLEAQYIDADGNIIRQYSDCTVEKTIKYSSV